MLWTTVKVEGQGGLFVHLFLNTGCHIWEMLKKKDYLFSSALTQAQNNCILEIICVPLNNYIALQWEEFYIYLCDFKDFICKGLMF